jgi:hypothetical protein
MKKMRYLAAVMALTGCASTTGVVPAGKDQYMIAREDNGPAASLGVIKAQVLQEANAFCGAHGKAMQIVTETDVPRSLGQFPQTTLRFTCT